MARTFLRSTQIRQSDSYSDALEAGSELQSGSTSVESDLNALRSQMKRAMGTANWYTAPVASIDGLRTDLSELEDQKVLARVAVLVDVAVSGGANHVLLTEEQAPTISVAVAAGVDGAICAQSANSGGAFASHELIEVAGANAIDPKNLVIIRDATTGAPITSSDRDVFGLLQVSSAQSDDAAFSNIQGKISFVRLNSALDDLEACPTSDIGGKTINYQYPRRLRLDDMPEEFWLNGHSFTDHTTQVDITTQRAYDNQGDTPVELSTDAVLDLSAAGSWSIRDNANALVFAVSAGAVEVTGTLDVTGAASFGSTLAVTGAATLSDTLDVTGASTLAGAATLSSTLAVTGAATLSSTLNVVGAADFDANVNIDGTLVVTGASTLTGAATLSSTLDVSGASTLSSTLAVTGAATLSSTLAVTGASTLTGAATLSSTLDVTGAATLSSTLDVTGAADFDANVNIDGNLAVVGTSTFSGSMTIETDLVVSDETIAQTGALTVSATTDLTLGSYGDSIPLAVDAADWVSFDAEFPGATSLLSCLVTAKNSSTVTKTFAVVDEAVAADVDVGGVAGGANLDAQLPDMTGDASLYDVFVNGSMLRPGANAGTDNDYYPGTSLAHGQLKFEFALSIGDVICVVSHTAQ